MRISISGKQWKFPPPVQVDEAQVKAAFGSELLAKLLVVRGMKSTSEVEQFLHPESCTPTDASELPGIERAVARVNQAITRGEKITVFSDYDVDGVTGCAVLLTVLRELGAKVDHYIPSRTAEGYGLNLKAVSILASKHRTKLIITCDCGISNFAEINFAKSLGVETIVLDHHSMPELLPPAAAILHPKQLPAEHPLHNLPGVGVAYKFCEALYIDRGVQGKAHELLDFVTLGMIADMVPLIRENRYLVQIGLPILIASKRPGIQALLGQVNNSSGTDIVGFGLAPRINAAGRLSDANLALELMVTDDSEVAEKLAKQLDVENSRRQELCDKIMFEAEQMIQQMIQITAGVNNDKAIVIYKAGWHHGVVGIVASRLVEKYHVPVFIGELDEEEGIIKGSARGIEGIDLYAVLKANEQLMNKWGGHKMAAGFSLEAAKGKVFCQAIAETCKKFFADKDMQPILDIDAMVDPNEVNIELAKTLNNLAPFGMANKKPILSMSNITCVSVRSLGKEGKHSRIMLEDSELGETFEAILWRSRGRIPAEGQIIDLAFVLDINAYNGQERLQLIIADWLDPALPETSNDAIESVALTEELNMAPPVVLKNAASSDAVIPVAPMTPLILDNQPSTVPLVSLNWKDLREQGDPRAVLDAARRNLGAKLAVFNEGSKESNVAYIDRTGMTSQSHLLFWQFPPGLKSLQNLVLKPGVSHIYLLGAAANELEGPNGFLKRLMGLVRFAVNQREGKVEGEKLAVALASTKMSVALGLTLLRKIAMIDWFSEEGFLYLDILEQSVEQPGGRPEELPEFRQLANSLKDIYEFRKWCQDTALKDIQLVVSAAVSAVVLPVSPNHIEIRTENNDDGSSERSFIQGVKGESNFVAVDQG